MAESNFAGADLAGAILTGANLHGAILAGTDLTGANLSGARCLSEEQLGMAMTDGSTVVPEFEESAVTAEPVQLSK